VVVPALLWKQGVCLARKQVLVWVIAYIMIGGCKGRRWDGGHYCWICLGVLLQLKGFSPRD
jgi:hypothetical protein